MTTTTRPCWQLPILVEQVRAVCLLDENGCWLWNFGVWAKKQINPRHYPAIRINGKRDSVARWLLLAATGEKGKLARHTCDVPRCCNPDHLLWGTQLDNMRDAVTRGRVSRGKQHGARIVRKVVGDQHHARRRPETLARGARHGAYTHPESVRRGTRDRMPRASCTTCKRELAINRLDRHICKPA